MYKKFKKKALSLNQNQKKMKLKCVVSLEDFFYANNKCEENSCFKISMSDVLVEKFDSQNEPFGFSILRDAIKNYEEQNPLCPSPSKSAMPFFRENQRRLIGPELIPFSFSFFEENSTFQPHETSVVLTFELEDLIDFCLNENYSLIRCKYNREECHDAFFNEMKREYDKVFFDEENTGFRPDSHFSSILYKALFECCPESEKELKEWRISTLVEPADADYIYDKNMIKAVKSIYLPKSYIKQIKLYPDYVKNQGIYTTLIGFLKKNGLVPERLLVGLIE